MDCAAMQYENVRHCEHSEAIQSNRAAGLLRCARNDEMGGGFCCPAPPSRWFPLLLPGVVRTALRLYNFIREDLVMQQLRGPRYRWHLLVLNGFKAHSGLAKIPLFNTRRS